MALHPGSRGEMDEMTSPRTSSIRYLGSPSVVHHPPFGLGVGTAGSALQAPVPAVLRVTSRWQHWRAGA